MIINNKNNKKDEIKRQRKEINIQGRIKQEINSRHWIKKKMFLAFPLFFIAISI